MGDAEVATSTLQASPMTIVQPDCPVGSPTDHFDHIISIDGHKEALRIAYQVFCLPQSPKPYHLCHVDSWPCCSSGLSKAQVDKELAKECNEKFSPGSWIYLPYERKAPSKPRGVSCAHWTGNEAANGSDSENNSTKRRRIDNGDSVRLPSASDGQACGRAPLPEAGIIPWSSREACDERESNEGRLLQEPANSPASNGAAFDTGNNNDVSDPMDKFVGLFISKIKTGLDKLKDSPYQLEKSVHIGYQLHQHLLSSSQGSRELEEILKAYGTDQKTIPWQADFYRRYLAYRRRSANPQHSETGDVHAEVAFKKREFLCKLLSTVVNELEPAWGVCASLVYNAFEETRFKASTLSRVAGSDLDRATKSIVTEVKKIKEITLRRDTRILNPAFFISCIFDISPSEACRSIKLDNLAQYDLQNEIKELQKNLKQLGLGCGKIPLSALLSVQSKLEVDASDADTYTIRFCASTTMDDPTVQETSSLPSADNDSDLGTGPTTVGSTPHVESRIDHESLAQREHANMEYAEGHESDESARDDETLHHVTTGEDTPSAINVNGDKDTIFAQYTPSISTEERAESSRTDANMPNQSQRLSIEKLLYHDCEGLPNRYWNNQRSSNAGKTIDSSSILVAKAHGDIGFCSRLDCQSSDGRCMCSLLVAVSAGAGALTELPNDVPGVSYVPTGHDEATLTHIDASENQNQQAGHTICDEIDFPAAELGGIQLDTDCIDEFPFPDFLDTLN